LTAALCVPTMPRRMPLRSRVRRRAVAVLLPYDILLLACSHDDDDRH
jgi:hypothetical protein